MLNTIEFQQLSFETFEKLKSTFSFNPIRLTSGVNSFGENIYSGNTITNQKSFLFEYYQKQQAVISFITHSGGRNVYYYLQKGISTINVDSLIRGNITKHCLQEQGNYCLHASAICVKDEVILFIGEKGAGKSTLASYFHIRNHEVWCDDYSVLQIDNHQFLAAQGETSLKVNPDIVSAFGIPDENLEEVFQLVPEDIENAEMNFIAQKQYFKSGVSSVDHSPKKIAAVFFIQKRTPNPAKLIKPIDKSLAFSTLMNEILLPGINSQQYLNTYFQSSMRLLHTVPSYSLHTPDSIQRIHHVYDAIMDVLAPQ